MLLNIHSWCRFLYMRKKDEIYVTASTTKGRITMKNLYSLPLMSAALVLAQWAQLFTKLDLHNAYNLMRIRK